jgi:hypothetical protein
MFNDVGMALSPAGVRFPKGKPARKFCLSLARAAYHMMIEIAARQDKP